MVTDQQTHKQTHRQDQLQYTAPLSLVHSVISTSGRCSNTEKLLQNPVLTFITTHYNSTQASFTSLTYLTEKKTAYVNLNLLL